jgi:hypothetical protein
MGKMGGKTALLTGTPVFLSLVGNGIVRKDYPFQRSNIVFRTGSGIVREMEKVSLQVFLTERK